MALAVLALTEEPATPPFASDVTTDAPGALPPLARARAPSRLALLPPCHP